MGIDLILCTLHLYSDQFWLAQGRQSMVGGVGTATEDEEDVNPAEARTWLQDPDKLLNLQGSAILERVRK